jgi:hypothetical protein
MTRFTRREAGPEEAPAGAEGWLRERLGWECDERGLTGAVGWEVEQGRREAGPAGGPRLSQLGFRIHLVEQPSGTRMPLACFIAAGDIDDEEQRSVVEQILALWMDRALDRE